MRISQPNALLAGSGVAHINIFLFNLTLTLIIAFRTYIFIWQFVKFYLGKKLQNMFGRLAIENLFSWEKI